MERKVKVVCSVVAFLGLSTVLLAFSAEAIRIAYYPLGVGPGIHCTARSPLPSILGLAAMLAIVISQTVLITSAGCICCTKSPRFHDSNWGVALVCFILCWLTYVIACLQLLDGMLFGKFCHGLRPGVFAGGAIFAVANTTFGIIYYLILTAAGKSRSNPDQGGIAMGQPQIPPISQDPVFVHEDTHIRRQFT